MIDRVRNLYKKEHFDKEPTDEMLEEKITDLLSKPVENISLCSKEVKFAAETKRGKLKFEQVNCVKFAFHFFHLAKSNTKTKGWFEVEV